MAGFAQYVGLRLSTDPEAVPTASDMGEGELAFNVASGRIYARFGESVRDITDRYTRAEIDQLLADKAASVDLAAVAKSGKYDDLLRRPTLGTAAALDAPATGNAGAKQAVKGSDSRLSDSRAPKPHSHPWSEVMAKPDEATRWPTFSEVADKPAAYPPSAHKHTLADISDAGTAAAADVSDFDPVGSAARAERRLRDTLGQRPDPLLMHFL